MGHRLWIKDFPRPTEVVEKSILIVGAGVSGLSAGRELLKKNKKDFLIVELENRVGGNSGFGENKYSKYPLAAHYLPLPNPDDAELIAFLYENKIITHFENNLPVFDESQLCADPKERLFIHNTWQEDLIPKYGNSIETDIEFKKFFDIVTHIREERDQFGKYYFTIPIKNASRTDKYQYLDAMTMKEWLFKNEFQSEELYEYVNYCCRDDFGLGIDALSAWAGMFYFCARKNHIYNSDSVLTWPEGNGRLVSHLSKNLDDYIDRQSLVYDVVIKGDKVEVLVFQPKKNQSVKYVADKVICATPQYINQHLISSRKEIASKFDYAPWFTATITLNDAFYNDTFPLCWDNVIYKGEGLGYVYNQHQNLEQINEKKVITYYYSFSGSSIKKNRKKLFSMKEEELKSIILSDLVQAHPNIENSIENIEVYKLGHGMISPKPNFFTNGLLKEVKESIQDKIFFAHTDLSGISIFEEAFHQGIDVVNKIL